MAEALFRAFLHAMLWLGLSNEPDCAVEREHPTCVERQRVAECRRTANWARPPRCDAR